MKIHNTLPLFLDCLKRWETVPSATEFQRDYAQAMVPWAGNFFEGFHGELLDLNWDLYRTEALRLDPEKEEARLLGHLRDVERLFGFELGGEAILMGAFTVMDGFARFDQGNHRVFLGVDESHGRGRYLDVLETHELTHVARETRPEVWEGWGLDPKMKRKVFLDSMPLVEHLMNEGFSCVVSELLVPDQDPWAYAYQTEDSLAFVRQHGPSVDRQVHAELRRGDDGDYGRLYDVSSYHPPQPSYAHYVWAWQWVKSLLQEQAGGDPRALVSRCSKDFLRNALEFRLC